EVSVRQEAREVGLRAGTVALITTQDLAHAIGHGAGSNLTRDCRHCVKDCHLYPPALIFDLPTVHFSTGGLTGHGWSLAKLVRLLGVAQGGIKRHANDIGVGESW